MCKVKVSTLDVILLCLTIISFSFIPHQIFTLVKYVIIAYLFVKYCREIRYNKRMYFCLIAYSFVLTFSTNMNINSFTWSLSALMNGMQLVVIFLVLSLLCHRRGVYAIVRILFFYVFVMLFLNDISMIIIPYNFSYAGEKYLIGSKFSVSYCHSILCGLCYILQYNSKKKRLVVALIVYSGAIAALIHCTTGILITLAMAVLYLAPKWVRNILERPSMVLAAIAIENILIWGSISILKNPFVQSIIKNVFHKSSNMTGRALLYSVVLPFVEQKPLFGYGYNTEIFHDMFGYGNAQNGLFHIVIQAGIIGAILYFGIVYFALSGKKNKELGYGMYVFIYAMILGSAVEINLSTLFMLGVAVLCSGGATCENGICNREGLHQKRSIYNEPKSVKPTTFYRN